MAVELETTNTFEQNLELLLNEIHDEEIKELIRINYNQIISLNTKNEQTDRLSITNAIKDIVASRVRDE